MRVNNIEIQYRTKIHNQFLFNMENQIKNLCSYLNEINKVDETIASNKLSFEEVNALMNLIDLKKKSYLDLNDIHELVGKVTQKELFDIFKLLDRTRTGQIRIQSFQEVFGNPQLTTKNCTKEQIFPKFYKMIDTIKDKSKIISGLKRRYSFNSNDLKRVYEYITNLLQSKYLTLSELITVFKSQFMKFDLNWKDNCENVLKDHFAGTSISQLKFIEAFSKNCNNQQKQQEQLLLSGISQTCQSRFTRNQASSLNYSSPSTANYQSKIQRQQYQPIQNKRPNQLINSGVTPSRTTSFSSPKNIQAPKGNHDLDKIQNNINEVLSNINERREKLRKDSIERKKMIDDVMNRKKQLCGINTDSNQREYQPSRQFNGIAKKSIKSYLSNDRQEVLNPSFTTNHAYKWQRQTSKQTSSIPPSFSFERYTRQDPTLHQTPKFNYEAYERSYDPIQTQSQSQTPKSIYEKYDRQPFLYPQRKSLQQKQQSTLLNNPYYEVKLRQRPQTPNASMEASQILKKYTGNTQPRCTEQQYTLKSLCKSKSSLMTNNYFKQPSKQPSNFQISRFQQNNIDFMDKSLVRGSFNNSMSRLTQGSKENVLKRAEEEATKKIEEIERKARMKVLQRKGGYKCNQEVDFNRFMKRGINY